jgi:hypothetical protein
VDRVVAYVYYSIDRLCPSFFPVGCPTIIEQLQGTKGTITAFFVPLIERSSNICSSLPVKKGMLLMIFLLKSRGKVLLKNSTKLKT